MRFSITGGSDVAGSAERAPLRPALFDRLAVGVITVANSEVGIPATLTSAVLMQEPHMEAEGQGRVREHGREEGSQSRLPSDPVENKADGPSVIAAVVSSPDPQTLAGADGRRSTPRSNVAGAKSGSSHRLSLVGPATEPGYGCRKFDQAVTNSHSQAPIPPPADKPEADPLLPSVSGAYSPWAVRRSSNYLRSLYP